MRVSEKSFPKERFPSPFTRLVKNYAPQWELSDPVDMRAGVGGWGGSL